MAGLFGATSDDLRMSLDDLDYIAMRDKKLEQKAGLMQGETKQETDAGDWWAWLSGQTRKAVNERVLQVQEELKGMDLSGTSEEYQRSLAEGIAEARAYREKWDITSALGDAPTMLEEQGVFPQTNVEPPAGVAEEDLDANVLPKASSKTDTTTKSGASKPEPDSVDTSAPQVGGIMSKPEPKVGRLAALVIPEFEVFDDPYDMSELEILARTIEAEAKSESYQGKIAVGAAIANRASSGRFGKGIHGVILKKGQFSPWNFYTKHADGRQGKNMLNYKASVDAYKAANAILTGDYEDPTQGSTHYVNERVAEGQKWIDTMKGRKRGTVTIGNHLFGNADNNKKYDGKSWILSREKRKTSPRPKLRPTE